MKYRRSYGINLVVDIETYASIDAIILYKKNHGLIKSFNAEMNELLKSYIKYNKDILDVKEAQDEYVANYEFELKRGIEREEASKSRRKQQRKSSAIRKVIRLGKEPDALSLLGNMSCSTCKHYIDFQNDCSYLESRKDLKIKYEYGGPNRSYSAINQTKYEICGHIESDHLCKYWESVA